jgi:hypothetical protein
MRRSVSHLTEEEAKCYEAPYPDKTYKAAALVFPLLVCDTPDAEGAQLSRRYVFSSQQTEINQGSQLVEFQMGRSNIYGCGRKRPCVGSTSDEASSEDHKRMPESAVGNFACRYLANHFQLQDAGHFVQEWGEEVVIQALKHFRKTVPSSNL